jgi:predicted component of type VI protein secretion system
LIEQNAKQDGKNYSPNQMISCDISKTHTKDSNADANQSNDGCEVWLIELQRQRQHNQADEAQLIGRREHGARIVEIRRRSTNLRGW